MEKNITYKVWTGFLFRLGLVFFFLACFTEVKAIGRGCYVDGVLYTTNTAKGNRFFYRTSGTLISDCGFVVTGSNDGNCRLYNSGNINKNASYTLYAESFGNKWEEISCPIDNEVWMLLVSVSVFVVLKVKGKI
ncbi:MAG: hypothetical protein V4541_13580 [Bacteroidota bacterium]